jgi:hypothetical protein
MSNVKYPEWVATKLHRKMHDDFKMFLWWLWRQLGLPDPTPAQYEMADWLQHGPRKRIVMAFRGVGKSWITAAFVLWLLLRDPQEKVMVVSASEYKATEFATFTKQLIETIPLLSWLRARPKDGQRDSVLAFDVGPARPAQAPSVRAVGVTGQMTGGRATTVVFDDIEVPNNSDTEGKREKLDLRAREMGGAILMPGGHSIGLGTPQSIQTIYAGFEERGYRVRIWPARYPSEEEIEQYGEERLCPSILRRLADESSLVGRPLDPSRFDEADLLDREAEYGRSGFRLQFMLDTTLSDADRYPLKLRDLIVMNVDKERAPVRLMYASGKDQMLDVPNVGLAGDRFYGPLQVDDEFRKYEGSVLFVDPSGRGKDETAFCVAKMLHGRVFIRRWGGFYGNGYDDVVLQALAQIAHDEDVNYVATEDNFGDGMFNALFGPVLQKVHPCTLEGYRVSGMKEARIADKLEPVMNSHRLVMDKEIVEDQLKELPDAGERKHLYNGFYQMSYLTRERGSLRQDDRIDVLAEAVGYFTEAIARDVESAADRRDARERKEALDDFVKNAKMGYRKSVVGGRPKKVRGSFTGRGR